MSVLLKLYFIPNSLKIPLWFFSVFSSTPQPLLAPIHMPLFFQSLLSAPNKQQINQLGIVPCLKSFGHPDYLRISIWVCINEKGYVILITAF